MKDQRFTFLCSEQERKLLTALARHLNRSQGDSLRFLIRVAAEELHPRLEEVIIDLHQAPGEKNG